VRVCAERLKRMAWKIFDAAAAIQDGMARSRSAPSAARRSSSLTKPAASRGPGPRQLAVPQMGHYGKLQNSTSISTLMARKMR
jgi:hypothetical protein